MPKLIITLTEKHVPVPDDPDRLLIGIETDIHLEFEEGENPNDSLLPRLLPFFDAALKVAQEAALGKAIMAGDGNLETTQEAALAAATAPAFPEELP